MAAHFVARRGGRKRILAPREPGGRVQRAPRGFTTPPAEQTVAERTARLSLPGYAAEDAGVYVLETFEGGPIKVGFSAKPAFRVQDIQVSCPLEVRVFWFGRGPAQAVRDLETEVHRRLKCSILGWVRGEWYSIKPSAAARIIRRTAEEMGVLLSVDPQYLLDKLD